MEILNLLFMLFAYYLFYFLEFYQKTLLIFGSCMFVSLLANHGVIENKSNDPNGNTFMYFILNTIINCILNLYYIFVFCSNKIIHIYGFSHLYQLLNGINYYFVQGRDQMISYMLQHSMNLLMNRSMPQFEPTLHQETQKLEIKKDTDNKKTFENKDEMNIFLDSLLDKKEN